MTSKTPAKKKTTEQDDPSKDDSVVEMSLLNRILQELMSVCLSPARRNRSLVEKIYRKVQKSYVQSGYQNYRRAFGLKTIVAEVLLHAEDQRSEGLTAAQIDLDASGSPDKRLEAFTHYFKRLKPRERVLLLLKEKYEISWVELSMAFNLPVETLKLSRQQALGKIEGWIWNQG